MDGIKEMWGKLPKWAKIGVPVAIAAIAIYVYVKDKGSSSSTATDSVASGDPDSSGASTTPATTDPATPTPNDPATPVTPLTPTTPTPEASNAGQRAWALGWDVQAAKNSKRDGIKNPTLKAPAVTADAKTWMSYGNAEKALAYKDTKVGKVTPAKPTTVTAKTVASKTNKGTVSHIATPKKESPKAAVATVTHGLGYIPPKK